MTPIPANIATAARIFPQSGYGIDVTVPHRGQGDDGPPQAIQHRAEDLRLCPVFEVVHAESDRDDDHRHAGEQCSRLVLRKAERSCELGHGVAAPGELSRCSNQAKQAKRAKRLQVEPREQTERQNGQEAHDSEEAEGVLFPVLGSAEFDSSRFDGQMTLPWPVTTNGLCAPLATSWPSIPGQCGWPRTTIR